MASIRAMEDIKTMVAMAAMADMVDMAAMAGVDMDIITTDIIIVDIMDELY